MKLKNKKYLTKKSGINKETLSMLWKIRTTAKVYTKFLIFVYIMIDDPLCILKGYVSQSDINARL